MRKQSRRVHADRVDRGDRHPGDSDRAGMPLARVTIEREKEHELRHDLWEMRDAIDRYKDAADRGAFQIKVGSGRLSAGPRHAGEGRGFDGKKSVPAQDSGGSHDEQAEWGMRSMQDDPTRIPGAAERIRRLHQVGRHGLDGTKYKDW